MAVRFEMTSSDTRPASDLLDALHREYDERAGRPLVGGPSAEPADFAPPGGTFLVAFDQDTPVARCRGIGSDLLHALEDQARSLGFVALRLDCEAHNWALYQRAGYREITDYNDNLFADHWAEKAL